jgi:LuxR family quorum-sensing system transcriptional regulator CciR
MSEGEGTPKISLSERQLECLKLTASGRSSPEIARALGISPRTVDQYITDACRRLGVRTRVQAVVVALKAGIL